MASESIIQVQDLVKHFPIKKGIIFAKQVGAVRAVDGVSFDVRRGETLGIVGESGCGKSTTARLITRLLQPTSGSIVYEGQDIAGMSRKELKPLRRDMQMIFQDPYSSLNPRKTVGSIISEPFVIHGVEPDEDKRKKLVQELMDQVGLNPEHYNRLPHEFSGGQRQRIGVARAVALKPKVIVADEPVSALDVSIQAQILNLLRELQKDLGLTIIFIAHDLSVVRHMCDRIAVMYLGKLVELATADELYQHPRHPYTGALLSAVPVPDPVLASAKKRQILGGDVPSPANPPPACRFHTRCPKVVAGTCDVDAAGARGQGGRQHRRLPLPADGRRDQGPGSDRRGLTGPARSRSRSRDAARCLRSRCGPTGPRGRTSVVGSPSPGSGRSAGWAGARGLPAGVRGQASQVAISSTGARAGTRCSWRASPRCRRPSARSAGPRPTAARPASSRRTAGVRQ